MKHGCLGYGIYTIINEMLADAPEWKLARDYDTLSYHLREDADIIRSVVEDFTLFVLDGDMFFSQHILEDAQRKIAVSEKRAEAGRKGGSTKKRRKQMLSKCQANAKQMLSNCLTNASDVSNEQTISELQTSRNSTSEQIITPNTAKEEKEKNQKNKEEKELLKEKLSIESKKKSTSIDDRKAKFYNDLIPYVETYGKDMIREFYDYWSEANRSATKMRWEQEQTWELNLRLKYWAKRDNKYGRNQKHADSQRRQSQIIAEVAELDRDFLERTYGSTTSTPTCQPDAYDIAPALQSFAPD
jgi:hypothetical protein